jgi:hypothetical protein
MFFNAKNKVGLKKSRVVFDILYKLRKATIIQIHRIMEEEQVILEACSRQ